MKNCFSCILLVIFLIGFTPSLSCRKEPAAVQPNYSTEEFLAREGNVDGDKFKYRIYLPANRKPNELLPVMLYLHGAGNRGEDNESQLNGLAEIIRSNREQFSFIVVIPQCPEGRFWDKQMIARANKALDDVVTEYNGDETRLYLSGFSLGGFGVWTMAAAYPNKFAALVPMSGRVVPRSAEMKNVPPEIVAIANASDPYRAFAERIGKTPLWIFHGSDDNLVPVENSRKIAEALTLAGNINARYREVERAGHEPLGFQSPELFEWLVEKRKLE